MLKAIARLYVLAWAAAVGTAVVAPVFGLLSQDFKSDWFFIGVCAIGFVLFPVVIGLVEWVMTGDMARYRAFINSIRG